MIKKLPTAEQLARLPLRAVVAYAARCARRISRELYGVIEDETVEGVLTVAEKFVSIVDIEAEDGVVAATAAARVTEALMLVSAHLTSEKRLAAMAIISTATTTFLAVHAATSEHKVSEYMASAARAAERTARTADVFDEVTSAAAIKAAVKDYEILLNHFGEQTDVIPGDPIEPTLWLR